MNKEQVAFQRALTAWINHHVKLESKVTDLGVDSQDGVLLCHVVSHCLKTKIRGISKDKKMNISLALDTAVDAAGETLQQEDVLNLNVPPLLAFYWNLIEKHLESVDSLKDRLAKALGEEHISDLHIFGDGKLLSLMIEKRKAGLINKVTAAGEDLVGDASKTHSRLSVISE